MDKRASNDRKTKEEKNVRRRVYDALNVLIASGVLKKNANKNVMYEDKPESRMKGLRVVVKRRQTGNKKKVLLRKLEEKVSQRQEKLMQLEEASQKLNAIQNLIKRNTQRERGNKSSFNFVDRVLNAKVNEDKKLDQQTKLHFPLILLETPNSRDNQISL